MPLEQIFTCPKVLTRLRNGPLATLLNGFCIWLQDSNFRRESISKHLRNVSRFNDYLGGATALSREVVTSKEIVCFFKSYPIQCGHKETLQSHLRDVHYSINRFVTYLVQKGAFVPEIQTPIYQNLFVAYLSWLRNYQHLAFGSVALRRRYIIQFLCWLGPQATIEGLSQLTSSHVETFFLAHAQSMGKSSRRSLQATLRTFFRFCLQKGYIRCPLDKAVPTIRTYKLATVPRTLSDEQAQQVLQSIDTNTSVGKRDYAILLLLYTFGVRGGQVRALRLEDIRWAEEKILFKALKNGKESLLPLTAWVGNSLFDYIKSARPSASYPQVFLTARAPHQPLYHASAISEIVQRNISHLNIKLPSKGAHLFRHCFASRMIQQGHSLKAIADILGHRHLATTFIYTKVDFNALKQVALPWPQEV